MWAWLQSSSAGLSWHFFVSGSRWLLHGLGLNLYAEHPDLQIGPLAFVVAAPLTFLGEAAQPLALGEPDSSAANRTTPACSRSCTSPSAANRSMWPSTSDSVR